MTPSQHVTVLLNEAVKGLAIKSEGVYIDATFGYGGHARLILQNLGRKGRLITIDRDPAAASEAKKIVDPRFTFIHGSFSKLKEYLVELNLVGHVDGILIDLGVSSPQIDNAERGFSFLHDGPLDMRMDTTQGQSASDWLLRTSEQDLAWVLKTFGEERFAKRIAKAIVERNRVKPILRTHELVDVIKANIPYKDRHKHPATRTFQAIRIYVNGELTELTQVLVASEIVLAPKGRLSVISFHSLEDRVVKQFISKRSSGSDFPPGIPLTTAELNQLSSKSFKSLGKYKPSEKEIIANPRARSAILRIAERL